MGFLAQFQRRAIESLKDRAKPMPQDVLEEIRRLALFTAGGKKLFIAGISNGAGTCSDIYGMDVLVLTEKRIDWPRIIPGSSFARCKYAVLVRNTTKKERESYCFHNGVELLDVAEVYEDAVFFRRTGACAYYPGM